ncbi:hypothetical protein XELAEV_18020376mg [Xenopus laevis]|uniref:Uncharacterized protein n=1 Tax=Xenopus laevis TaxID=8355 RepID=A0A974HQY7_XENLA|nr:hypothetical protein XELAEV_18020376mg [Xenopus laevis]
MQYSWADFRIFYILLQSEFVSIFSATNSNQVFYAYLSSHFPKNMLWGKKKKIFTIDLDFSIRFSLFFQNFHLKTSGYWMKPNAHQKIIGTSPSKTNLQVFFF